MLQGIYMKNDMLKVATGRGVGSSGSRSLGSSARRCARAQQLTTLRPYAAASARAASAVTTHPCPSTSIRRMPYPLGGALAATRQQRQQARRAIGGDAAAAALPRGNSGGTAQDSTQGAAGTAASANMPASADAAAQLALEAALLPRLEAVEGEVGAMEGRTVQRIEAQVAALRSELLMALWEKEDAAKQQPAAAAAEIAALRSEIKAMAQRQKELEGRVAAAAAAAAAARKQGAKTAAVAKSVVQPINDGDWKERLFEYAKDAVFVICAAVYAALFLGAAITFVTTCANQGLMLGDETANTAVRSGVLTLSMGGLALMFGSVFSDNPRRRR